MYIKHINPDTNNPQIDYMTADSMTIQQFERGAWCVYDKYDEFKLGLYLDRKSAEDALDLIFQGSMSEAVAVDIIEFKIYYAEVEYEE